MAGGPRRPRDRGRGWNDWQLSLLVVVVPGFLASVLLNLVGNSGAPRAPGAYWRWVPPLNGRLIGVFPALHIDQVALAMLVGSWLGLGLLVRNGRCSARRLLIIAAVWSVPLLLTPPLFSDDIYDYVAVGALQVHHFDPYLVGAHSLPVADRIVGAVSPAWTRTPTPYGPGLLLLTRAAAALSGTHDIVAVTLLRLVAVAALLGCGLILTGLARQLERSPESTLWLFVVNPLTLVTVVGGGHNDVLMVAAMLGGYLVYRRGHPFFAQVVLAGAADIKVVAVVGIAVLALQSARMHPGSVAARALFGGRQLMTGLLGFAAFTTLLGLTLDRGLLAGWGWIHDLYVPGTVVTSVTPTDALYGILGGPISVRHRHGQPTITISGQPLLVDLRDAAVVVFLLVTVVLALRLSRLGAERLTGLILFAFCLLGQILWPWYLLWPLGFLALAGARRERVAMAGLSVALLFIDSPGGPTLFGDAQHLPRRGAADLITVAVTGCSLAYLCARRITSAAPKTEV